jgi:prepilin-type processing-associated H-X9-DG protein
MARRAQCSSHLKQIALATHRYHDAQGSFPWGNGPALGNQWSALALVLPFLEQTGAFNAINFIFGAAHYSGPRLPDPIAGIGVRVPINRTAFTATLHIVLCPSDSRDGLTQTYAHTNYAACSGTIPLDYTPYCDGVFCKVDGSTDPYAMLALGPPLGSCVRLPDITDGVGYTAAYSERVKGLGYNEGALVDPLVPSTTYYFIPDVSEGGIPADVPIVHANCLAAKEFYIDQGSAGLLRHLGLYYWVGQIYAAHYNHTMPPNAKSCAAGNDSYSAAAYGPSSRHPGGANIAFCDGSVRFLQQTIAPSIFWALGTREGGELISGDSY